MIWIARLFLPCLFSLVIALPAVAVPIVQSTFDAGAEGWGGIIIDGSVITASSVSFVAGAGNPGGALRHDAPSDSATSFFLAPASFATALHSAVGGSLSWDSSAVSHAGDVYFASFADVNIRAGDNRIRLAVTPPPPAAHPAFTHYEVPFDISAGWLLFDGASTTAATQAQIDSVLAGAESLIFRAEYFSGPTADIGFLDNVAVDPAATVPEPSILLLFGSTLLAATSRGARRSR
jgi:hypothetical protein